MTILGVPGWPPTDDMQPKLWAKAHLSCDPSHEVWIVRTSGKCNMLSYQGVFPMDPYVHAGWCGTCNNTSRRKGRIGIITITMSHRCIQHLFLILFFSNHSVLHRVIHWHRMRNLGACRLHLQITTVSCCASVMDPDRHEDWGEMYSPDDQREYT